MIFNLAKGFRRAIALSLASALGAATLSACSPETTNPTETSEVEVDEVEAETTASETTEATAEETALDEQMGEIVYFHSDFQNQVSEALFVVQEDGENGWGEVLVLNQSESSFQVPSDAETPLWVLGTVEDLSEAELQEQGVPESEWENYQDRPVVIAERITLVPDPSLLVENAESFLNQSVTVYGEVEVVAADNTFVLNDPNLFGGKGIILVQGADADLDSVVGEERAVVSGVLRPYVIADLEKDYDLSWDLELKEQLEADYQQTPVIVVDLALPVNN